MLSVSEAAKELNVSASRVRKMISDGVIKAEKVGNTWSISESEIATRLAIKQKPGRPKKLLEDDEESYDCIDLHDVYLRLKDGKFSRPCPQTLAMMDDKDEVGFVLCVCDYFLDLKQRELIAKGVF
ncbi:MAG: helix-turn-helix domain-containing protein [Phoenicibacter congonensis]|uniref:Helix-turn-helix domain-containing protein n=1 Tax=Phoenicibacter congonensis TaxID=1944646 RepID=A0AA43RL92_9ACTN|nr:helix-turn-helix domain-containing protein [Phoenicibacter congonensis]